MTLKDWLKDTVKNKINDFRELFSELKLKDESESFIQSSEFVMCYPKEKLEGRKYKRSEVYMYDEKVEDFYGMDEIYPFYRYDYIDIMKEIHELHGNICG